MTSERALGDDELEAIAADAARLGVAVRLPVRRDLHVDGATLSSLFWNGVEHEEAAPAFVFLHGGGLHVHTWDSTILLLDRPALALDLPGHGDSTWRADFDYAPTTIGRTIASALETLPHPVVLVGHSLGGMAAITAAAISPGSLRQLVLVDVMPSVANANPGRQKVRSFMRGPESYGSVDEILARAREFGIGGTDEGLRRGILLNTRVRDDGRVVFKHHLGSPPPGREFGYDPDASWAPLESLAMPITLVLGSTGIVEPAELERFSSRIPHADVHVIEAGHTVQRDAPRELAALLRGLA